MNALQQLLNELESHQLQVVLVPLNPRLRGYNEGGMRRVCANKSPRWYSQFCGRHPSSRGIRRGKFDTRIKRANTLRALNQLLRKVPAGKYGQELLQIARQQKAA